MNNIVSLATGLKKPTVAAVLETVEKHIRETGDTEVVVAVANSQLGFTLITGTVDGAELSWLLTEALLAAHGSGSVIE